MKHVRTQPAIREQLRSGTWNATGPARSQHPLHAAAAATITAPVVRISACPAIGGRAALTRPGCNLDAADESTGFASGTVPARTRATRSYVLAVGLLEICGYLLYLGCGPLFTNDAKSLWPDTTPSSGNSSSSTALPLRARAVARMIASDRYRAFEHGLPMRAPLCQSPPCL